MWVVKWRHPQTGGVFRAHDARHEGRRFATREEAEAQMRKFRGNDNRAEYWVEEVGE